MVINCQYTDGMEDQRAKILACCYVLILGLPDPVDKTTTESEDKE